MNPIEQQLNKFDEKFFDTWGSTDYRELKAFIQESMELMAEQIIDEIPNKHYETDGNGTTFAKTSLKTLKDQLRKKYLGVKE